jgi:hypothetical protein
MEVEFQANREHQENYAKFSQILHCGRIIGQTKGMRPNEDADG